LLLIKSICLKRSKTYTNKFLNLIVKSKRKGGIKTRNDFNTLWPKLGRGKVKLILLTSSDYEKFNELRQNAKVKNQKNGRLECWNDGLPGIPGK